MEEIWKPWPRNPQYLVSSYGNIKGIYGKDMASRLNNDGYCILNLRIGKNTPKSFSVHRVVAETFLGLTPEKVVDHINGIRTDNRVENLLVCDQIYNIRVRTKKQDTLKIKLQKMIQLYGYDETEEILDELIQKRER